MAITTMDGLIAALATAQTRRTYDASMTSKAAGDWQSLWTATGYPGAGAVPATGAGAVPTNATAGAVPFVNVTGSNTLYLMRLAVLGTIAGGLMIYDRLVHTSGLSGTVTTAQTVNTTSLTRSTTGVGVEAWLEIYTATGATAVTATISYTDPVNGAGRSGTTALIASPVAGCAFPFTLQAGDTGVVSVQSVTLSATTGTAGNFGITLVMPIDSVSISATEYGGVSDWTNLGLPIISDTTSVGACLAYMMLTTGATTGNLFVEMSLGQG